MIRTTLVFIFITLALTSQVYGQQLFTLSGTVADSANGESLLGAIVSVQGTGKGMATNEYGFYSISLPPGNYKVAVQFTGYQSKVYDVQLNGNTTLNIKISNSSAQMKEVVITADKDKNAEQITSTQMSAVNIPIEKIRYVPTIGGETDVIKVMQLMPGIKRGGEGQNTMLVRGGSGDDNLILLDEAVVYNVSHLFGFPLLERKDTVALVADAVDDKLRDLGFRIFAAQLCDITIELHGVFRLELERRNGGF